MPALPAKVNEMRKIREMPIFLPLRIKELRQKGRFCNQQVVGSSPTAGSIENQ